MMDDVLTNDLAVFTLAWDFVNRVKKSLHRRSNHQEKPPEKRTRGVPLGSAQNGHIDHSSAGRQQKKNFKKKDYIEQ